MPRRAAPLPAVLVALAATGVPAVAHAADTPTDRSAATATTATTADAAVPDRATVLPATIDTRTERLAVAARLGDLQGLNPDEIDSAVLAAADPGADADLTATQEALRDRVATWLPTAPKAAAAPAVEAAEAADTLGAPAQGASPQAATPATSTGTAASTDEAASTGTAAGTADASPRTSRRVTSAPGHALSGAAPAAARATAPAAAAASPAATPVVVAAAPARPAELASGTARTPERTSTVAVAPALSANGTAPESTGLAPQRRGWGSGAARSAALAGANRARTAGTMTGGGAGVVANTSGASSVVIADSRTCPQLRDAGIHDIMRGTALYRPELDSDGDGIGCESDLQGAPLVAAPSTAAGALAYTGAPAGTLGGLGGGLVALGVGLVAWARRR